MDVTNNPPPTPKKKLPVPPGTRGPLGRGSGGCTGAGFRPGQSGNPTGLVKLHDFPAEVRKFLRELDPDRKDKGERMRTVVELLAVKDPKVLLHYAFGKPQDNIALQNPDGTPLLPVNVMPQMSTEDLRQLTAALAFLRRQQNENRVEVDVQGPEQAAHPPIDVGGSPVALPPAG